MRKFSYIVKNRTLRLEILSQGNRMAEGLEIRENLPDKGRGLFASKDYKEGDVLFEERPLVSDQFAWNTFYKYRACEYCMRSLETAQEMSRRLTDKPDLVLPYPKCCQVKPEDKVACPHCQIEYCSQSCFQTAWDKYHKTLCLASAADQPDHPINRLLEAWRNIHYPPETCSIMLIAKMIAFVRQASDKDVVLSQFSRFCKATVNQEEQIAHKLLGKQFQDQLELLRTLLTDALYEDHLDKWFTPEGFRSLFAMIGTNGQGIGTSSISVWARNSESLDLPEAENDKLEAFIDQLYDDLDRVSAQFLNCEGSGLYLLQSTCNHSCKPNAEVTFPHNDFTLVVKALSDIKAGEEIYISYLDECERNRSRHSRQKMLRENYLFSCQCELCQSQAADPDVTSSEDEDDEEEPMEACGDH